MLASASRLLDHPLNFTPLIGITLFCTAYLPKKWMGIVLSLTSWIISDILINTFKESASTNGLDYFYSPTAMGVYGSIVVIYFLGFLLRSNVSVLKLFGITLSSSFLFYFITNSITYFEGFYGYGFTAYINCMVAGIPFIQNDFGLFWGSFFLNGIMGDLFYTSLLFGGYYLINQRSLKPSYIKA